ncbi:hypothetical protein THAOC_26930, partial [Thalassiosira oceanica]
TAIAEFPELLGAEIDRRISRTARDSPLDLPRCCCLSSHREAWRRGRYVEAGTSRPVRRGRGSGAIQNWPTVQPVWTHGNGSQCSLNHGLRPTQCWSTGELEAAVDFDRTSVLFLELMMMTISWRDRHKSPERQDWALAVGVSQDVARFEFHVFKLK